MKLSRANYQWALKHILLEGDTDLFPPPFEIDVLAFQRKAVLDALANIDIGSYAWLKIPLELAERAYDILEGRGIIESSGKSRLYSSYNTKVRIQRASISRPSVPPPSRPTKSYSRDDSSVKEMEVEVPEVEQRDYILPRETEYQPRERVKFRNAFVSNEIFYCILTVQIIGNLI